jgi:succinyldiaminopimelate transaminase
VEVSTDRPGGFDPPPYPYDRLAELSAVAATHPGGVVDLSVGTPGDPPPAVVVAAMADAGPAQGYPPSAGTVAMRTAFADWAARRLGASVDPETEVAACIGTKEFVAGVPHWLRLRDPSRDTVLYPEVSYPTYAMGATLAGCRAVPVPMRPDWSMDLDAIDPADADRAVCLWLNTPANPSGGLDDLVAAAGWGRGRGVPVLSDECYVEFTWDGPARTILHAGCDGVLAVHSLSKRSNLAGARVGAYAGDAELVGYLRKVRQHAGFMVPGPVQSAAVAAWGDDAHVDAQRDRYWRRLQRLVGILATVGVDAPLPRGAFYLWAAAPDADAWGTARMLAERLGIVVSPGEFYGPASLGWLRVAAVATDDALDLVASRAGL